MVSLVGGRDIGRQYSNGERPYNRPVRRLRRLKLTLEFDGTDFMGWQQQKTGERTVQGVIQQALTRLPGEHSQVHGDGRTDRGVHALALTAHLDTSLQLPPEKFRLALNADRKSTRLNSSHVANSYAVFCLK